MMNIRNFVTRRLVAVAAGALTCLSALAWGQKGHDVTAAIAENHLTPATAAAVADLFDGMSPVYWANWLDNASHTPQYAYSKTWHYRNTDADKTYFTMPVHPDGDVVTAIRYNISQLADTAVARDRRVLALKMLVHLVGDMHQPMHMGRSTDRGGNSVKVKYFGRDANLHGIWDTNLLESAHRWSYTEWREQLDRLPEAQQLVVAGGNLDDWAQDATRIAADIYARTPEGAKLSYDEVALWSPVIERQLVSGGLRLAHILNSLFDPAYPHRRDPATF